MPIRFLLRIIGSFLLLSTWLTEPSEIAAQESQYNCDTLELNNGKIMLVHADSLSEGYLYYHTYTSGIKKNRALELGYIKAASTSTKNPIIDLLTASIERREIISQSESLLLTSSPKAWIFHNIESNKGLILGSGTSLTVFTSGTDRSTNKLYGVFIEIQDSFLVMIDKDQANMQIPLSQISKIKISKKYSGLLYFLGILAILIGLPLFVLVILLDGVTGEALAAAAGVSLAIISLMNAKPKVILEPSSAKWEIIQQDNSQNEIKKDIAIPATDHVIPRA